MRNNQQGQRNSNNKNNDIKKKLQAEKSQHEEIIQEYLQRTKLEGILLNAVKQIVGEDLLPKNPYCDMTRSLVLQNMKQELVNNFEQLSKIFRKNQIHNEGPYKIASVGDEFKVYGLKHILEFVDIRYISNLVQSIDEILPDLKFDEQDIKIEVSNSISGGLIFKSDLIPYASSHPKELEIFTEVFISSKDLDSCLDMFGNFVYDDVLSVSNVEDMHIIKEFILYQYNEKTAQKNWKKSWTIDDLIRQKNYFVADIKNYAKHKDSIYWKGYMKVERFSDQTGQNNYVHNSRPESNNQRKRGSKSQSRSTNLQFNLQKDKQYEYIEVYKVYNLHYINTSEADLRRNLVDSILQILTSELSALVQSSKNNLIIQHLLKLYNRTGNDQVLRPIIQYTFQKLRYNIEYLINKSSNTDLIRYRDYLRILISEAVDQQNDLVIGEEVGSLTRNVPDYIFHTLTRNNLLNEDDLQFLTFDEFFAKKQKTKVIHISSQLQELKRQPQYQSTNPVELESTLILNYLNHYKIYDNIFGFLQNLFFGQLLPNPFSQIISQFESKALRYLIYEMSSDEISQSFLTLVNDQNKVGNAGRAQYLPQSGIQPQIEGNLQADLYIIQNNDMKQQGILPVFGVLEVVSIAGNLELGSRKQVMDLLNWKQAIKKQLPSGYIISDLLSVSAFDIFAHPLLLANNYIQWDFQWDFLIKGRKEEHARQIYLDIIVKYVQWVEESTQTAVLGLFINEERIMTIENVIYNSETSESRQNLAKFLERGEKIVLKLLIKVETRYKICNLYLNYIFIDEYNEPKSPRDIRNQIDTYLRLFFKKDEALSWYKLFPYSRLSVASLTKTSIKRELAVGELGRAMKLELINLFIHENTESFIDNARILFGYSESFYNHSKECLAFSQMINYVKEKSAIESVQKRKKVSMVELKPLFMKFCSDFIETDLYDYENIYMENLGASLINQMELVRAAFQSDQQTAKPYVNPLGKMADMFDFMGDSAVLSFKKMSEIEFHRQFLFA